VGGIMFGFMKKKQNISIKSDLSNIVETPKMKYYREDILKKFERCLDDIDKVREDKHMSAHEKYAVMTASLFVINKITMELTDDNNFFKGDKQFEKIISQLNKDAKNDHASYIG
jgi:hypothetical protein